MFSLSAFVVLAAIHTWPLASAPAHWARIDGDGGINTWAVSWVAHALVTDPRHVFEGNIFYPEHLTVAYSESMIVQALFAVPVIVLGGSAVLAYSVSVFAGFVLTGWAFCLLVRKWTGSWAAGYVSGSLAAFNAYSLVNFTHLQFLHTGFIAAMLFALDRLITTLRFRDAVWLAVAFTLQALTSIYLMVFSVFALTFALIARAGEWLTRAAPLALRLAAASVIAALLLAPDLLPYWRVHETMHYSRSADAAQPASWRNYLSTAARVHYTRWSKDASAGSTTYVFPGIAALALAGIGLADRRYRRDPRVRMVAAAAAGCVAMSFAPSWPFWRLMHAAIPLLQMVRAVNLIAQLALLFLAVLAGFGVAAIQGWLESWQPASPQRLRVGAAVAVALVVIVNGEAFRAPIGFTWFDGVPKVYDVIAKAPAAVVIEEPFPMPQQWFLNAPSMVYSTRYWRPMLNGYSGFRPASYDKAYEAARAFPSDDSLIALSALGVTHVVVHQQAMNNGQPDPRYDPYEEVASLRLLARDDDTLIYELLRR
jgi:hypothetical protein